MVVRMYVVQLLLPILERPLNVRLLPLRVVKEPPNVFLHLRVRVLLHVVLHPNELA